MHTNSWLLSVQEKQEANKAEEEAKRKAEEELKEAEKKLEEQVHAIKCFFQFSIITLTQIIWWRKQLVYVILFQEYFGRDVLSWYCEYHQ